MKVSLIFTPNQLNTNFQELVFRDEICRGSSLPKRLLVTWPASWRKRVMKWTSCDMDAERLTYQDTLDRLRSFSPDLLGFTTTTSSFHPVLKWIMIVSKRIRGCR